MSLPKIKSNVFRLAASGLLAVSFALFGQGLMSHAASIAITGTITDPNGNGIQNVSVTATDPDGTTVDFGPVSSSATGTYELDVDPGTYDFHFTPPTGSGLDPVVDNSDTVSGIQTVNLQLVASTGKFTLSGVLTDANGTPISGASLVLGDYTARATSDSNGKYSLTANSGQYPLTVTGTDPATGQAFTLVFNNTEFNLNADTTQNIQLPSIVNATVNTNDPNGNPLSGILVNESISASTPVYPGSTIAGTLTANGGGTTNSNGKVTEPTYQGVNFSACAAFSNGQVCTASPVSTGSGNVNVTLTEIAKYTLSGDLTTADGTPISGANLILGDYNARATTDSNGNYSLTAKSGQYPLTLSGTDPETGINFTLAFNNTNFDLTSNITQNIQLPSSATATVNTIDQNGNPLSGITVNESDSGSVPIVPGSSNMGSLTFTANGRSNSAGSLAEPTYQGIDFSACGSFSTGTNCTPSPVSTANGNVTVTLTAPARYTLSGALTDANGTPISGASLVLGDNNATATTDSNGNFSLTAQPGEYPLTLSGTDPATSQAFTLVINNNEFDLNSNITQNIQLPSIVNATVITNDPNGNPLSGIQVNDNVSGSVPIYPGSSFAGTLTSTASGTTNSSGNLTEPTYQGVSFNACASFSTGQVCNSTPVSTVNGNVTVIFQEVPAPTITSSSSLTVNARAVVNFTVTTTGSPAPSLTESGSLPSGIKFTDNGDGTGTLSGQASPTNMGYYFITFSATDGAGTATQNFLLTVNNAQTAPTFVSPTSDTEAFGSPVNFTVDTTGNPIPSITKNISVPTGMTWTVNGDGTATLAGTPSGNALGTYTFTFKARNINGSVTQTFVLTITKAPVFTGSISGAASTAKVGVPYSLNLTTKGVPTASLTESGILPSGLNFVDNGDGTGTFSGTPAAGSGGSYPVIVTATNANGSASKSLTLTVDQAPTITSANSASATVGSSFAFQITSTGYPAPRYTLIGVLPSGVTFHSGTGSFSGTPRSGTSGTYPLLIDASNSLGVANQTLVLTVN